MAGSHVEVDQTSQQLMKAINRTIGEFTTHTPLAVEQIVVCLGYVTGRAIGHIDGRNPRRIIRDAVHANIDHGIDVTIQKSGASSIIMPTKAVQ